MEKQAHLANLIYLAKADGILHPMESLFIQSVAFRMGINQMDFIRISKNPELTSNAIPPDEETRVKHFCELVVLMQVDYKSKDEERKLLEEIGKTMDIPIEKIKKLEEYLLVNKLPADYKDLLNSL